VNIPLRDQSGQTVKIPHKKVCPRCCIVNAGAIGRDVKVGRSHWRLDECLMDDPARIN